jgi:hypothetical protein
MIVLVAWLSPHALVLQTSLASLFESFAIMVDSQETNSDGSRVGLIVGLVCGLLAVLLIWFLRARNESSMVRDEQDGRSFEMAEDIDHTFFNPIETVKSTTFNQMNDIFAHNSDERSLWQ